jgi:VanZ family protein
LAPKKAKLIIRWLPSIIWMIVIYFFSSLPTAGVISTNPVDRFYIFKSFHLIEYAVLGVLLLYATRKLKFAVLIAYLYACTDELHQFFTPGRTSKFTDTLIDLLGITIGAFIFLLSKRLFTHPTKRI